MLVNVPPDPLTAKVVDAFQRALGLFAQIHGSDKIDSLARVDVTATTDAD